MFLYLLFGRGLILDGWRGWFYVAQRVIAELLLSLRLCEEKLRGHSEVGDRRSEVGGRRDGAVNWLLVIGYWEDGLRSSRK